MSCQWLPQDMRARIQAIITDFVRKYSLTKQVETKWRDPITSYASTHDPLFQQLKPVISTTHCMPTDLLPEARIVVAYFIPFTTTTVETNHQGRRCSREWAIAYLETNQLIIDLNHYLIHNLEQQGFATTALPPTHHFDNQRLLSKWSHKHVAYIAGLGTFGLHHMLITEKGCCGRLGSLITTAEITPSVKPENTFCLSYDDGSCQQCVEYCVFGALTVNTFNRHLCYDICLSNAEIYSELGLADVCGKCICVTPCSFINPVR
jgi:epoxyqueuosine reductase QueG